MNTVAPVEAQLAAYNARDVDAFLACYAPDVVAEDGSGSVLMSGAEEMRSAYEQFFQDFPELHGEVVSRIQVGDYVIDEERIHGWQDDVVSAVAIYHVSGAVIDHVRFLS
jgi:hypothetical protein